jgi:2-keto-4-pentenoate hydratase/2-oxohepta-3-ene-1,7-dioic acid hydratase in catechol pathway
MAEKKGQQKFCRFNVDGKIYNGILRGGMVDIAKGDLMEGFSDMRMSYPISRVKFLPPLVPVKIWCVGRNFLGHVKELEHEIPDEPLIFMKPVTTLIGCGDPVRIPEWAGRVDYEGELAVVIGRRCHKVSETEALSYVKGYSCYNDITARDLQIDNHWTIAKGFDGFGPFGPSVLITEKMPGDTKITTRLNGNVMQQDVLDNMIFPVPVIISYISRFATLEPGDIIATGTPEGVGRIQPGDIVEIEIDGIGVLFNPVISD